MNAVFPDAVLRRGESALPGDFVRIPGGRFLMGGRPDDKFANAIELPRVEVGVAAFLLGRHPVTEAEWAAFLGKRSASRLPQTGVSWDEALEYAGWFSKETGMSCRLPTEREWEYACRAGGETIFPGGNDLTPREANFLYDEFGLPVGAGCRLPVGSFAPNAFGLYDMTGNVCEWTADPWAGLGGVGPDKRAIRGGAWDHLPRLLRCSWRDWAPKGARYDNLGFRLAADLMD